MAAITSLQTIASETSYQALCAERYATANPVIII